VSDGSRERSSARVRSTIATILGGAAFLRGGQPPLDGHSSLVSSTAVEFGIIAPVLIALLIGTMGSLLSF